MILTPVATGALTDLLGRFAAPLAGHPQAAAAFAQIRATWPVGPQGVDTPRQRADAVALAHAFGIATLEEEPASAFSWDGQRIRTVTEASVIIHEVGHWLLCPPERRGLPDFGLGAGPETGRRDLADAARCVEDAPRETEEVLTSLLGILWEAELNHPAILAFLEQNWLEGVDRPSTAAFFIDHLAILRARHLVNDQGRPCPPR